MLYACAGYWVNGGQRMGVGLTLPAFGDVVSSIVVYSASGPWSQKEE